RIRLAGVSQSAISIGFILQDTSSSCKSYILEFCRTVWFSSKKKRQVIHMALQHAQPTELTQQQRRLFTIEEYERMMDARVFDEDERIELIRGEIVQMPLISDGHAG